MKIEETNKTFSRCALYTFCKIRIFIWQQQKLLINWLCCSV